ncbi:MAG: hypothetical protein Q9196_007424, partial [Gyalolechia fulgens]
MHTPFERMPGLNYGTVASCTQIMIEKFNNAAKLVTGQAGGCSICHDTLGDDGVSAKLAMTVIPDCKHCFHEICIMQWLSPITLPSTDQASTIGTTSISGSVRPASSEAPRTTDDDNDLPQQISSQATRNFLQEVAGIMQHVIGQLNDDGRRESSGEEHNSLPHYAMQRARELAGRLASRDEEQVRVAVREINERGPEILMNEDLGPDDIDGYDSEDDLEEGEIRDEESSIFPS